MYGALCLFLISYSNYSKPLYNFFNMTPSKIHTKIVAENRYRDFKSTTHILIQPGLLFSFLSDMRMGKSKNKKNGGNINIKRNILMLISLSATLLYVAFSVVVIVPGLLESVGIQGIYILCIAGGILINGTPPLFFELSVDVVFPIAEGLTTTLLTLVNNVGGLVFLLLPSVGII